MNSLDHEMSCIICDQLIKWNSQLNLRPRVLILSGAGSRAFCAGGDIVSLYKLK